MRNTVLKGLLFLVPTPASFFLNGLYSPERGPTGLNCSGLLACFILFNENLMSKCFPLIIACFNYTGSIKVKDLFIIVDNR